MTTTITAVQGTQVKHGMLIDLTINTTTYYISNLYTSITWNGHAYTQLGHFMGVTEIQDDLRPTNNQITVTLSGIPPDDGSPNYMSIALNSNLKGSKIKIYRAFFDITNGALMTDQVYQRFNGYVSNYSLNENWDQENRLVSNSISIQCSSVHAILEKSFGGRRTNEKDQQYWYTGDTGMYKIKSLADSQFDFGKPYVAPASATPAE
jgi:hypothetical protein